MEVFLGGAQAAVAEAFFDDLDVGAAGEQPGGVGVAQVVDADVEVEAGGGECGLPDVLGEPAAGDMSVGVDRSSESWIVFAGRAPLGAVAGVGAAAVVAAAAAEAVSGQGAVLVGAAAGVWCGAAELVRVGWGSVVDRGRVAGWFGCGYGEEQVVAASALARMCSLTAAAISGESFTRRYSLSLG